jgi:hypothetical protein
METAYMKYKTTIFFLVITLIALNASFLYAQKKDKQANASNKFAAKQPDKNKVLLDVDLSKGKSALQGGKVEGGKFVDQGWTPIGKTDNILWNLPKAIGVKKGKIILEMTNLNPNEQIKGLSVNKNQFFGLNEKADFVDNQIKEHGVKVRFRMGWYKQFKVETNQGKDNKWDEHQVYPLKEAFDPKQTYVFEVDYDPNGYVIKINGVECYKQPWPVNGFQTLQIGETYKSLNAIPGTIYKRIRYIAE